MNKVDCFLKYFMLDDNAIYVFKEGVGAVIKLHFDVNEYDLSKAKTKQEKLKWDLLNYTTLYNSIWYKYNLGTTLLSENNNMYFPATDENRDSLAGLIGKGIGANFYTLS